MTNYYEIDIQDILYIVSVYCSNTTELYRLMGNISSHKKDTMQLKCDLLVEPWFTSERNYSFGSRRWHVISMSII